MYEFLDAAIVRAPSWHPGGNYLPLPDLTGPDATSGNWRTWLKTAWQVPAFAAAVEAASPDLTRQVTRVLNRPDVAESDVRRSVLSTLRYLLRAQTRATPFGLLAGVAAVRIGTATSVSAGDRHRAVARPDAAWLADVASHLEEDTALLPELRVIANNLAVRRGEYVLITHRVSGTATGTPERVQIRATPPVRAVLDAAERPVRVADLAAVLAGQFPAVPGNVIVGLITKLAGQRFLLTALRPSATDVEPLAAILRVLDQVPLPADSAAARQRARLRAIRTVLAAHGAAAGPSAAYDCRTQAAHLMGDSSPLAIDLRLDWDLVIPRAVAAEAAQAAGAMTRLARRPALSAGWTDWHARFLDRYGPGAVVPVLDAVSPDTGLGYPAGYLDSPYATPALPLTGRDKLLLKLAHRAAALGDVEVIIDDRLISELSVTGSDAPVQPSAEITARVHAASARDLDEGRFTLHVTGASRAAGTIAGRFLHVLGDAERERMAGLYAGTRGVHDGGLTAQLAAAPLHPKTCNVARAVRTAAPVISIGEYREAAGSQIAVTDLAVTADARRLHLVSVSRGCPVHTIMLNAVDLAYHSHPLTRFLAEAPVALAAPCAGFEWGAAHVLPFLPAVRYRRTVLSPARWLLDAPDLPGKDAAASEWDAALAVWQGQVRLPEWVYLGDGDQCIRLRLTEPSHRALVRDELRRAGTVRFRSAPAPHDLGWAEGRVHEIVIPVTATQQAAPVRRAVEITSRRHGYLPGQAGRLYLQLHASHGQQDVVLTRHVPYLQRRLGNLLRTCWFMRYDQPRNHLRLRLALDEHGLGTAIAQVSAWTETLRDEGLVNGVSWETYYPEVSRFGGTDALDAAEACFAADSAAVIAQLTACAAKDGPDSRALAAASLIDIVASLIGDETAALHWLVAHTAADATPPPRPLYNQAVALVNSGGIPAVAASAWGPRRTALTVYRSALEHAGTVLPEELLPDLLHLHHARMTGPDPAAERACLHLARVAALSRIARARKV